MENFDATAARKIVDSLLINEESGQILANIKDKAEQCETVLHVYRPISSKTVEALRAKGFDVAAHHPDIIQAENLHYSIYW